MLDLGLSQNCLGCASQFLSQDLPQVQERKGFLQVLIVIYFLQIHPCWMLNFAGDIGQTTMSVLEKPYFPGYLTITRLPVKMHLSWSSLSQQEKTEDTLPFMLFFQSQNPIFLSLLSLSCLSTSPRFLCYLTGKNEFPSLSDYIPVPK